MFGDFREMVFYYFLVDDIIEIWEVIFVNFGRDVVLMFLRWGKFLKNIEFFR